MELWTLDGAYQPSEVVSEYNTLIWAERYSKASDFKLVSNKITEALRILPEGRYITLRDSTIPMKVETHKLIFPEEDVPSVEITGRACEACWLEQRASVRELDDDSIRKTWRVNAQKESDAAYRAMRQVLGDTARSQLGIGPVLPLLSPAVAPEDAIPELNLTLPADWTVTNWSADLVFSTDDVVHYQGKFYRALENATSNKNKIPSSEPTFWEVFGFTQPVWDSGTWYSPTQVVYKDNNLYISIFVGINAAHDPVLDDQENPVYWRILTGTALTYEIKSDELYKTVLELVTANNRGIKSVRPAHGGNGVSIEIYNGADLTKEVIFYARAGEFNDSTYLLSKMGSKNVAYVYGKDGAKSVLKNTGSAPSGLDRRVLLVDQSSEETALVDTLEARGLVELYNNNVTALFSGSLGMQFAQDYNRTYFLGDIVRFVGDYGLAQDVRVAEFIRSEDASGETAYPTFEAIS